MGNLLIVFDATSLVVVEDLDRFNFTFLFFIESDLFPTYLAFFLHVIRGLSLSPQPHLPRHRLFRRREMSWKGATAERQATVYGGLSINK